MDGAAITAGVGGTIDINGKSYSIRARTVEFYVLVEAEIVKLRGNPLNLIVDAAKNLSKESDGLFLIDTVAQTVANRFRNWRLASWADYGAFFDTPYGAAFQLWCCIKHNPAPPTPQEIQLWMFERVRREGLEVRDVIDDAINRAGSEDALGNSTGPSPAVNQVAGV